MLRILCLHRAEFEKAKAREKLSWICETTVAITALISIALSQFASLSGITYTLALISLIAAIARWIFRFQAKRHRNTAERARRVLLLVKGANYQISAKECTDLITSFSVSEEESKQWEDPAYFTATETTGYGRLAGMIQESAFFSRHLYSLSGRHSLLGFIMVFAASVAMLLILPSVTNRTWSIAVAQIACTLLMFLVSYDLLGRALAYTRASGALARIDDRLDNLGTPSFSEHDLILIWGDYNAAVQEAPLISTPIYEKHKDRLNRLYAERAE